MPAVPGTSTPRFVVDESSFDFRGISNELTEAHLDTFNLTFLDMLRGLDEIAVSPMWDAVECLDGCEFHQFLTGEVATDVDRDTRSLTLRLLSRCPEWNSSGVPIDDVVMVDGEMVALALSVNFALAMARQRRSVACLVFAGASRDGYSLVGDPLDPAAIFFFRQPDQLATFWRYVIEFERVPETIFFELATRAFPELLFHPDLSFRRFDGAYVDLRDRVAAALATINDHFGREFKSCQGRPYEVQSAIGSRGADISPESPNTRKSARLMRQRDVEYDGQVFRCEWHAKLSRKIDRIHFSVPDEALDGKILIGIFVSHLDT